MKKYGKSLRDSAEGGRELDAAYEENEAASEAHNLLYECPMFDAAVALAKTPAPNLAAALFKVELIKREQLYLYNDPVDCMAIVAQDMARLAEVA